MLYCAPATLMPLCIETPKNASSRKLRRNAYAYADADAVVC